MDLSFFVLYCPTVDSKRPGRAKGFLEFAVRVFRVPPRSIRELRSAGIRSELVIIPYRSFGTT